MQSQPTRSEEHTSELQSRLHLVCRLLLEKKKKNKRVHPARPPHARHTPPRAECVRLHLRRVAGLLCGAVRFPWASIFFFFFFLINGPPPNFPPFPPPPPFRT